MKPDLIAALSWYDEPPDQLYDCVTSLARAGTTKLVALDGPYEHFPHTHTRSSIDQYQAIHQACNQHRITPYVLGTRRPFPNQIAKRTHLWYLCEQAGTPYRDWVLVIDADERIEACDQHTLWRHMMLGNAEVFALDFHTHPNPDQTPDEAALARVDYVARSGKKRRLFQLMRNTRVVEPYHWCYVADRQSHQPGQPPEAVVLYGHRQASRLGLSSAREVVLPRGCLVMEHWTLHRGLDRKQAKAEYVAERTRHSIDL